MTPSARPSESPPSSGTVSSLGSRLRSPDPDAAEADEPSSDPPSTTTKLTARTHEGQRSRRQSPVMATPCRASGRGVPFSWARFRSWSARTPKYQASGKIPKKPESTAQRARLFSPFCGPGGFSWCLLGALLVGHFVRLRVTTCDAKDLPHSQGDVPDYTYRLWMQSLHRGVMRPWRRAPTTRAILSWWPSVSACALAHGGRPDSGGPSPRRRAPLDLHRSGRARHPEPDPQERPTARARPRRRAGAGSSQ